MTVTYSPDSKEDWKWYYDNGNPYFEATIVDNLLQGQYQIWYENGQLAESINFKDNLEIGIAEFFHPNGQMAMKGVFKDGEMVGEWQFYDEQGNPPTGMWEWKFAASPENLRVKGLLIYGNPSGEWMNWTTANQGQSNQKIFTKHYNLEMFIN
jgi:antitoxin component YwqK of YwqJK toxin-antitoxin module